ncbi:hypothetical protein Bbelb_171160 [Branchiostoma belcheri]|nr:hypothetical protein Bbelb_171160 [Branchiostoma belcheri]
MSGVSLSSVCGIWYVVYCGSLTQSTYMYVTACVPGTTDPVYAWQTRPDVVLTQAVVNDAPPHACARFSGLALKFTGFIESEALDLLKDVTSGFASLTEAGCLFGSATSGFDIRLNSSANTPLWELIYAAIRSGHILSPRLIPPRARESAGALGTVVGAELLSTVSRAWYWSPALSFCRPDPSHVSRTQASHPDASGVSLIHISPDGDNTDTLDAHVRTIDHPCCRGTGTKTVNGNLGIKLSTETPPQLISQNTAKMEELCRQSGGVGGPDPDRPGLNEGLITDSNGRGHGTFRGY